MHPSPAAVDIDTLVAPKERVYYALLLTISLAAYAGIALALVRVPASMGGVVGYALSITAVFLMLHGLMVGRVRGNAVRVGEHQFPHLHGVVKQHARALGLANAPDVYVLQAGGMLNAFATRFLGRDFVVIYSDVLEMAEARGEAAVGFIVGHELAHVRRGHLRRRWLTLPGRLVPYLGAAYSRACEYTCDRMGAHCQPDGAIEGLLVLSAGRHLYRQVNVQVYAAQCQTERGFWVRWAELLSTHPNLPKRVNALLAAGFSASVRAASSDPAVQQLARV